MRGKTDKTQGRVMLDQMYPEPSCRGRESSSGVIEARSRRGAPVQTNFPGARLYKRYYVSVPPNPLCWWPLDSKGTSRGACGKPQEKHTRTGGPG